MWQRHLPGLFPAEDALNAFRNSLELAPKDTGGLEGMIEALDALKAGQLPKVADDSTPSVSPVLYQGFASAHSRVAMAEWLSFNSKIYTAPLKFWFSVKHLLKVNCSLRAENPF